MRHLTLYLFLFFLPLFSCGNGTGNPISSESFYDFELEQPSPSKKEASFSVISWNVKKFGASKSEAEIEVIADIAKEYDVVALQEIVTSPIGRKKVAQLVDELNRKGASWDYIISDKTPTAHKTECYAILWKSSIFSRYGNGFLWDTYSTVFHRIPFLLRLKHKKTNEPILFVNYHSRKWNDNPGPEIEKLSMLPATFPDDHIIICGDFNVEYGDDRYVPLLKNKFSPLLFDGKTTLKKKGSVSGDYMSRAIDNIFMEKEEFDFSASGTEDFVPRFSSVAEANGVSDHLGVWGVVWVE